MIDYLRMLFEYDDWANRESLASIRQQNVAPPRSVDIMAHIVGCQWLWLGRLQLNPKPAEVWPQLSLEQIGEQLAELRHSWTGYLSSSKQLPLNQMVEYRNSKGQDWQSSVGDILFHTIMHAVYHRGQIATLIGREGGTSAYTDLIHCIRENRIAVSPNAWKMDDYQVEP